MIQCKQTILTTPTPTRWMINRQQTDTSDQQTIFRFQNSRVIPRPDETWHRPAVVAGRCELSTSCHCWHRVPGLVSATRSFLEWNEPSSCWTLGSVSTVHRCVTWGVSLRPQATPTSTRRSPVHNKVDTNDTEDTANFLLLGRFLDQCPPTFESPRTGTSRITDPHNLLLLQRKYHCKLKYHCFKYLCLKYHSLLPYHFLRIIDKDFAIVVVKKLTAISHWKLNVWTTSYSACLWVTNHSMVMVFMERGLLFLIYSRRHLSICIFVLSKMLAQRWK